VPTVEAITTADYPTPARRPANSRLDTTTLERDFGIVPRPWQAALDDILAELLDGRAPRALGENA
jgi:dTDP-4-dehydrorhamnose reductase